MLSSYQDTFIPFYSERAEVTPQIEQSTKEELTILSEMVTNFWRDLKKPECKTVIKKFDICIEVGSASWFVMRSNRVSLNRFREELPTQPF